MAVIIRRVRRVGNGEGVLSDDKCRYDLVIRNGRLVTGLPDDSPTQRDLGILGKRIRTIGRIRSPGRIEIDASGCLVTPGFIDIHSHTDESALRNDCCSKLLQGVTTEVCGQCGGSVAPISTDEARVERRRLRLQEAGWYPEMKWRTFSEFNGLVAGVGAPCNQCPCAGLWSIADDEYYRQGGCEFSSMTAAVERALDDGVFGLSVHQGSRAWQRLELWQQRKICSIVAEHGAVLSVHLSDYADGLLMALDRLLEAAAPSAGRLQMSHLKILGKDKDSMIERVLSRFETLQGLLPVRYDAYPYSSICTRLKSFVEGTGISGNGSMRSGFYGDLADFALIRFLGSGRVLRRRANEGWDQDVVAQLRTHGQGDLAGELVQAWGMRGQDTQRLLSSRLCSIGSDAIASRSKTTSGAYSPRRGRATFPDAVGVMRRAGLTISAAVSHMTYASSVAMGIAERGLLAPGRYADVVVLDARNGEGQLRVRDVIVNGRVAVRNARVRDSHSGQALQRAVI